MARDHVHGWMPMGPFKPDKGDPLGWMDDRGVVHNPLDLPRSAIGKGVCPGCDACRRIRDAQA